MVESEYIEIDIKGVIEEYVKQGLSLDEAIVMTMKRLDLKLNLEDQLLLEIWKVQGKSPFVDGGETSFPDDRDSILRIICDERSKPFKYLYNMFYDLRHQGLLDTKGVRHNRRHYSLAFLTDEGMDRIEWIRSVLKEKYVGATTTTSTRY